MDFPDPKKLKKLADACRKAGLKSFKCAEFEFVLNDEAPASTKKTKTNLEVNTPSTFQTDSLEENELLFWSSTPIESGNQTDGSN